MQVSDGDIALEVNVLAAPQLAVAFADNQDGQVLVDLATRRRRLYPAAWVYRWHGLRFAEWGAVLLVSRGAGDALPVRFNCPREVILCGVQKNCRRISYSSHLLFVVTLYCRRWDSNPHPLAGTGF